MCCMFSQVLYHVLLVIYRIALYFMSVPTNVDIFLLVLLVSILQFTNCATSMLALGTYPSVLQAPTQIQGEG